MTPQEFGERIRAQREAKGVAMEDLATRFKLSLNMLRAIENGRIEDLPHAVYARGFVRSYAQAVELDPEDITKGIESLFPQELFEDVPTVPGPIAKPSKPRGQGENKFVALVLAALLVGLPLVGGWFVITNYGDHILEIIRKPLSATTVSSSVTPALVVQEAPVLPLAEQDEPVASITPDTGPQGGEENAEPMAPESAQASVAEVPSVQEGVTASEPVVSQAPVVSGKHVVIQAREECWVQTTVDDAGTRSFTVYPGETSLLPYKKKITLVLGNAGGVSLTHNGKPYTVSGRANSRRTFVFE